MQVHICTRAHLGTSSEWLCSFLLIWGNALSNKIGLYSRYAPARAFASREVCWVARLHEMPIVIAKEFPDSFSIE